MQINELIALGEKVLMKTYGRFPISLVRGEGSKLYDSEGKCYLDFLAGIAVNSLGYGNETFVRTLQEQVAKLVHASNYFHIENQTLLAQQLVEHSVFDRVFFSNSGAEANEGAIKLARRYAFQHNGVEKSRIVAMSGSFHGRTLATLTITSNAAYREGCGPMPANFEFADFNDIESLAKVIDDDTAAVILEPVQGEGGVHPADPEFLRALRRICDEHGALLIYDEIQCGMGRTGKLFAYEHSGVAPDIMTLAKALGNGVPIGAILTSEEISTAFTPGSHGTTFGGNPLATAAGLAVMKEMIEQDLPGRAAETGEYFFAKLRELAEQFPCIVDIRGLGLMIGVELSFPGKSVVDALLERGFIVNCTAENVLRFVPPLIITLSEIDALIEALAQVLATRETT